jgi:formylglycine-generating enzyme required for sulfatase activity
VTQAEFGSVTGKNPSKFKDPRNPVENVSWADAAMFCAALSKKTGQAVALPTEAQWEYACRAGTKTRFSFGQRDTDLGAYGWYEGNSGEKPHPVGQKKPNPAGLYDMHGNVVEWCADWYQDTYKGLGSKDPTGPNTGSARISRSGSWKHIPYHCRAARRANVPPVWRRGNHGFRVVVAADSGGK